MQPSVSYGSHLIEHSLNLLSSVNFFSRKPLPTGATPVSQPKRSQMGMTNLGAVTSFPSTTLLEDVTTQSCNSYVDTVHGELENILYSSRAHTTNCMSIYTSAFVAQFARTRINDNWLDNYNIP